MANTVLFQPNFGNLSAAKQQMLKVDVCEITHRQLSMEKVAEIYHLAAGEYRRWAKVKRANQKRNV